MLHRSVLLKIPPTVWALSVVSLFMDMSSELVHSLLPVLLVTTLASSVMTLGLIEGIAEATALMVKVFSGAFSDFLGRRKGLVLLGYGLAALTKPLFPMAHSAETVLTARLLDRIGKGIRGAPRDALMAEVSPPEIRGACFGLRQSMDTVGAFLGPLLAILLMYWFSNHIRVVLWFAVLPAIAAVCVLLADLKEPEIPPRIKRFSGAGSNPPFPKGGTEGCSSFAKGGTRNLPISITALKSFSSHYWWLVVMGAAFTLARFSEAFLILRAQQAGLMITWLPVVMVIMSLVYSVSAYPVGILSDRFNRKTFLGIGLLLLVAADVVLARATSITFMFVGVALWGLHMGFTQGVLTTLIADETPTLLKGTAFGLFNLVSGVFVLLASVIAGWLWTRWGAEMTFYAGAGFAAAALIILLPYKRKN